MGMTVIPFRFDEDYKDINQLLQVDREWLQKSIECIPFTGTNYDYLNTECVEVLPGRYSRPSQRQL